MRLELARYGDAEEISVQNTFKLDGDVCQSGNTSIALIPNWHKSVENLAKIGERTLFPVLCHVSSGNFLREETALFD
jgi:hypothetical protein